MRIVCDNPHHDAGEGVCVFCVQGRINKAVLAERDRCIRDVCPGCEAGKPTIMVDGDAMHPHDDGVHHTCCEAAMIRWRSDRTSETRGPKV